MGENKEISKELKKLNEIFKNIPKDKKKLVDKLIENAAFMAYQLEELQNDIIENGGIITQVNGNGFKVCQESPAQKSYSTLINRYTSVIKQLTDLLPSDKEESISKAGEKLAEFVAKGKSYELR